ncbi:M48 family metallopeptidase [Chloroflexota bacterium]
MDINNAKIIRSKRKTIAIVMQNDGSILIRAPLKARNLQIQQFVNSKKNWIETQQKKIIKRQVPAHMYLEGEKFLFLGKMYDLTLSNTIKLPLSLNGRFILDKSKKHNAELIFIKWYRERSRENFSERANYYSKKFGYRFNKIRISSARTRWGSCSSKGNLSFTWRLIMAPQEIIDYVIIHELVHLRIKNHSSSFWSRVSEHEPDFKRKRKWLRENGHLLIL